MIVKNAFDKLMLLIELINRIIQNIHFIITVESIISYSKNSKLLFS